MYNSLRELTKNIVKYILLIISLISFACLMLVCILTAYYELFEYGNGGCVRNSIISLSDNGLIIAGVICLAITLTSHFIRKKFFGNKHIVNP